MLYQAIHVTGKGRPSRAVSKRLAMQNAQQYAMDSTTDRYVVVEEGTEKVVAVCWPDGGVDYMTKPYPTISQGRG